MTKTDVYHVRNAKSLRMALRGKMIDLEQGQKYIIDDTVARVNWEYILKWCLGHNYVIKVFSFRLKTIYHLYPKEV